MTSDDLVQRIRQAVAVEKSRQAGGVWMSVGPFTCRDVEFLLGEIDRLRGHQNTDIDPLGVTRSEWISLECQDCDEPVDEERSYFPAKDGVRKALGDACAYLVGGRVVCDNCMWARREDG